MPARRPRLRRTWSGWSKATSPAPKNVGAGVSEYRIDFGPGYRVYLGKDGDTLIILLGGGTKKRQQKDIEAAQALWREYKQRKRQET